MPFGPDGRILSARIRGGGRSSVGTIESSMSTAGLDNRHRNKDGEISGKHGNTLSGRCVKFTHRVLPPGIRKPRN